MSALAFAGTSVRRGRRLAVDGVDLHVAPGSWTVLLGPNGAGKSSLLRAAVGLSAYTGSVTVGGAEVRDTARRTLARAVALLPQQPQIPHDMGVAEYVLLGRTPYVPTLGVESADDHRVVADVLERLDLTSFAVRRLGELSGGELQRAVLGRALADLLGRVAVRERGAVLHVLRSYLLGPTEPEDECADAASASFIEGVDV